MQSVDLTYARYRYLTEVEHMAIDDDNCYRLFIGSKTFEKKYNINKSQLLEMYSYDEDRRQSKEARKAKIKP